MPERKGKTLPAFTCLGEQVDLWPVVPEGLSNLEANREGGERALELVEVIRRTEAPQLLGHVVEAIAKRGTFGGMELGFFHKLSEELMQPMPVREFVEVPRSRHFPALAQRGHLRIVA